jgi:SNF2 family DNA or RNA helicase
MYIYRNYYMKLYVEYPGCQEQKLLTNEENQKCPALVVVPPGLLQNWQREFQRWAPTLSFYVYHGPKRSLPLNKGRVPRRKLQEWGWKKGGWVWGTNLGRAGG